MIAPRMNTHYTVPHLKSLLNRHADQFVCWLYPKGSRSGQEWKIGSLQGEPGHSLSICIGGAKIGAFFDFSTGERGLNLIDLYCQAKKVSFSEAVELCSRWISNHNQISALSGTSPTTSDNFLQLVAADVYIPTRAEKVRVTTMVEILLSTPGLCAKIAESRGWREDTVRDLAHQCYLGWENNLALIYDTGVKIRAQEKDRRWFWWSFGKPWLWRGAYVGIAEVIYVCEGETDAISLIDAGFEEDGITRVIALPSATTFLLEWAPLFTGKEVVLALDNDRAGQSNLARVARLILPHAAKVSKFSWEALANAA